VFISLYFEMFWPKWLNFFNHFKNISVYDQKNTQLHGIIFLHLYISLFTLMKSCKLPLSILLYLLLVDAECRQCITSNKLNRKVSPENIKWLCSTIYTYLYNSYNTPATLYLGNGAHILSQEGVTQGDNAAMTRLCMQSLHNH